MGTTTSPQWGPPTRIMPANHWDWSMPVPFSQGWKCGPFIFVGGQISADENGKTIGAGDIEVQTRNTFENIRRKARNVLRSNRLCQASDRAAHCCENETIAPGDSRKLSYNSDSNIRGTKRRSYAVLLRLAHILPRHNSLKFRLAQGSLEFQLLNRVHQPLAHSRFHFVRGISCLRIIRSARDPLLLGASET